MRILSLFESSSFGNRIQCRFRLRAHECEDVLDVRWRVPEIPKNLEKDEQGQNEEEEGRFCHQKCGDGVLGLEILEGDQSNS